MAHIVVEFMVRHVWITLPYSLRFTSFNGQVKLMIPFSFNSEPLNFIFTSLELSYTQIVILSWEPAFPCERDHKLLELLRHIPILVLNLRDWGLLTDVQVGLPKN